MTVFGVSIAQVGRSDAGRRIHAAGVAFQRSNPAQAMRDAAGVLGKAMAAAQARLVAEAERQLERKRAEEARVAAELMRQKQEKLDSITAKVKAALEGRGEPVVPMLTDIVSVTAIHFGISRRDLLCHRRTRDIVLPRQIAMHVAYELTPKSLPEIGRAMGNRDHTTVLHAWRKIAALVATDVETGEAVGAIKGILLGQGEASV